MLDKIVAVKGNKTLEYKESITTIPKRLWWLLPDDMLDPPIPALSQGFPMIVRYSPEGTIKFTVKLQNFIFNLNRSDNEARDRMAFQGYRDTWNSNSKVRDHYNAITGEGDPNDLPNMQLEIGAGGNVVSGTPEISDGHSGIRAGIPVLRLETLDPSNLPATISYKTHPHLIHHLTVIVPTQYNGFQKRNPFPQMGGRAIAPFLPSYTALISPIPLYIEMSKLREVSKIPNPYNPEWIWE